MPMQTDTSGIGLEALITQDLCLMNCFDIKVYFKIRYSKVQGIYE